MQKIDLGMKLAALAATMCMACSAQAAVVIQEVVYDGPGTDPDDVFTEIFGAPGTDLSGWSLAGINGADGMVYRSIDLSGQIIPADGIFLVVTSAANAALGLRRRRR